MNLKNVLLVILFIFPIHLLASVTLEIKLENLKNDDGKIYYILFNQDEGFPSAVDKSVKSGELLVSDYKEKGLTLNSLTPGKYAISLFHDENLNGKLDTNMLGIPKEAFGFSNNPSVLFGPPSFNRVSFSVEKNHEIMIKLKQF